MLLVEGKPAKNGVQGNFGSQDLPLPPSWVQDCFSIVLKVSFLSDPCAHGVRSLGRNVTPYIHTRHF